MNTLIESSLWTLCLTILLAEMLLLLQTCNQTHPGMKMEAESVVLISQILERILSTLLDQQPNSLEDLADKVRSTFPSTLAFFVMKVSLSSELHSTNNQLLLEQQSQRRTAAIVGAEKQIEGGQIARRVLPSTARHRPRCA